jgi:hypothetical protein
MGSRDLGMQEFGHPSILGFRDLGFGIKGLRDLRILGP